MGQYLRPLYPGQLHTIRHNTWNLVFVLDLSSAPSLDVIASSITTMIQRGLPLRFGIVPMITEEDDDLCEFPAREDDELTSSTADGQGVLLLGQDAWSSLDQRHVRPGR